MFEAVAVAVHGQDAGMVGQRYERGSTIITSNLPFEDWMQVPASERLNGALLDRLTHHATILAMNGDSVHVTNSSGFFFRHAF